MKRMAILLSTLTTLGLAGPAAAQQDYYETQQSYSQQYQPQYELSYSSSQQQQPRLGDLVRQRLAEIRQRDMQQQQSGYRQQPQQDYESWDQSYSQQRQQQQPWRQAMQRGSQFRQQLQPGQTVEIAARVTDDPQVDQIQGEDTVITTLRTRSGQQILASFGRPEQLQDFNLQRNFAVLVTGQVQQIQGEPVLVVQEVRQLSRPMQITTQPRTLQQQTEMAGRQIGRL